MHVGTGVIFQGQGEGRTDRNVYRNELPLGDLAEPLGFESNCRVEVAGFGVNQEESRERFVEAAKMILEGLERGYVENEGKYYPQTRRELRPRPFKSFRGRTYAAAVSPESSVIMAKLGIGILII